MIDLHLEVWSPGKGGAKTSPDSREVIKPHLLDNVQDDLTRRHGSPMRLGLGLYAWMGQGKLYIIR